MPASSRCRPILRRASERCSPIRVPGPACRCRVQIGSTFRQSGRSFRLPLTRVSETMLAAPEVVLVEPFPRGGRHFLVAYRFEGRLAHQTLGMLLTRRLDRAGAKPLGFVANASALSVGGRGHISGPIADGRLSLAELFDEDMLGDALDAWLAESSI